MALIQSLAGRVATLLTGGTQSPGVSQTGGLRVTTFDALYMDAVRDGRCFACGPNAAITGIAGVSAIQTTAAQWGIFNTSTTRTMFFTALGASQTSATAAGVTGVTVSYCVYTLPVAAGFTAGMAITNKSATSSNTSVVAIKASQTVTTPAAPVWLPVAQSPHIGASATVNNVVGNWSIFGGVALGPLSGLGINVYHSSVTPLWCPLAEWIEVESTMF